MSKQGKCGECKTRYSWPENQNIKVADVSCPKCGRSLERTSQLSHAYSMQINPEHRRSEGASNAKTNS